MQMTVENFAVYVSTLNSIIHLIDTMKNPSFRKLKKLLTDEINNIKTEIEKQGVPSHGRQN